MKAVRRVWLALVAGALWLSPAAALAQQAPPPDTATPAAPDAVGPRALQNFSLNGTVTQPAAPSPAPTPRRDANPATQPTASATGQQKPPIEGDAVPAKQARVKVAAAPPPTPVSQVAAQPARQPPASAPAIAAVETPSGGAESAPVSPAASPGFAPDSLPAAASLAPGHGFPLLPWLLAALALGAGGAFLFWRNRSRMAFAGMPEVDAFIAPEPAPAPPAPPSAAPKARPAPAPSAAGIVSTRLRPWIEIGFQPHRCVLDDEKVTLEFDIELFNSGSAPARAVLVEASLFNAGATQEQDVATFFANPVGEGDRIAVIPPLQRFAVRTQVSTPRAQVLAYELAGRQMFVPVIAFNALYEWSGGTGQTSAAYLLGRASNGDKMAPFRLDLGPRIFRGLAGRVLPGGVRD
jgi:hypothetical protein